MSTTSNRCEKCDTDHPEDVGCHHDREPEGPKINCPHCGSALLWSEDRGAHCDGCADFDPETDLPNAALTDPAAKPKETL